MYMDAAFDVTGAGTKQTQPPVEVATHWNVLSVSADVKTFHITLLIRHVYSAASLMSYFNTYVQRPYNSYLQKLSSIITLFNCGCLF